MHIRDMLRTRHDAHALRGRRTGCSESLTRQIGSVILGMAGATCATAGFSVKRALLRKLAIVGWVAGETRMHGHVELDQGAWGNDRMKPGPLPDRGACIRS